MLLEQQQIIKLLQEAAEQREKAIMKQLSDLVSRGLLKIEIEDTALVRSFNNMELEYKEVVKVTLKDQEYIEALERENAELRAYRSSTKRNT